MSLRLWLDGGNSLLASVPSSTVTSALRAATRVTVRRWRMRREWWPHNQTASYSPLVALPSCRSLSTFVPSTHYERPKGGEGVGHGTRDHGGREDSDRETNRKDPRLFWSLLFPLVSRGSSLISSPHPSSTPLLGPSVPLSRLPASGARRSVPPHDRSAGNDWGTREWAKGAGYVRWRAAGIRTFILPSWLLPLWPNRLTPRDRNAFYKI